MHYERRNLKKVSQTRNEFMVINLQDFHMGKSPPCTDHSKAESPLTRKEPFQHIKAGQNCTLTPVALRFFPIPWLSFCSVPDV